MSVVWNLVPFHPLHPFLFPSVLFPLSLSSLPFPPSLYALLCPEIGSPPHIQLVSPESVVRSLSGSGWIPSEKRFPVNYESKITLFVDGSWIVIPRHTGMVILKEKR